MSYACSMYPVSSLDRASNWASVFARWLSPFGYRSRLRRSIAKIKHCVFVSPYSSVIWSICSWVISGMRVLNCLVVMVRLTPVLLGLSTGAGGQVHKLGQVFVPCRCRR